MLTRPHVPKLDILEGAMNWGTELWDQYDNLSMHTMKGVDFLERFGHFLRDRCTIEVEYASKLRKLVKQYQPKKKEYEDVQYTYTKSYIQMLNEINDLAGQHEVISENLSASIVKELYGLVKELKDERKRILNEAMRHKNALSSQEMQLEKSKKNYEKAYKDSLRAKYAYEKAEADLNLSRADVEKHKNNAQLKSQQFEDSKSEYANQLQKFNDLQHQHYTSLMPASYQELQDMDERRIVSVQDFMKRSVEVEKGVFPIIDTCLNGVMKSADSIDAKQDSQLVIERYKSGFEPPGDQSFEDLSNMGSTHSIQDSPPETPHSVARRSETMKNMSTTSGKPKKRGKLFGIFSSQKPDEMKEDYSDLPPSQRRKKLLAKLDNLQQQVNQETAARDALMKMKSVYEENPALGDPHSLDKQLAENGDKLDKLRLEQQKFQTYLNEAENKLTPNAQKKNRNSVATDNKISRSVSDVSAVSASQRNSTLSMPNRTTESSLSPESGIAGTNSDYDQTDFDDDYYQTFPVLGVAKALYGFDAVSCAQNEGSIEMEEGEEFHVIEEDQGDGWTRVRKMNGDEGFVPTSYIEIDLNNP